jgi:hypothetical protein
MTSEIMIGVECHHLSNRIEFHHRADLGKIDSTIKHSLFVIGQHDKPLDEGHV